MFEAIEFPSEGATLRGRLYTRSVDAPTLVMAHGTSATITMIADAYAEGFHAAGLNVLLYDHRNFGSSDGEPRQEINPWIQARGYRDAVRWLRAERGAARVALWGDSYTAMIVLVLGALIDDIAAVVAQIPATGIQLPEVTPDAAALASLAETLEDGDVSGGPEHTTGPIAVVSPDQLSAASLLAPVQAFRWFMEYGGRFGTKWENRVTRVIPPTPVPFHPILTAAHLTMPVQVIVGKDDEMIHCNRDVQAAVYDAIPDGAKEWHEIEGGHFGLLYNPGDLFDTSLALQSAFLTRVLL